MNKKLLFKLGLGGLIAVSALSFVGCGENNDASAEINSPTNVAISQVDDTAQTSVEGNEKIIASSENKENKESKSEKIKPKVEVKVEKVEENIKPKVEQESKKIENTTENVEQEEKEKQYYTLINNARQKQIDYINSIEDQQEKQSVQSSMSAAIGEATLLEINHPEDSEFIQASLQKVLG